MKAPSRILRFTGAFVLSYGLLIVPWHGWNALYGAFFRALGESVYGTEGPAGILHFRQAPAGWLLDTQVVMSDPRLLDASGRGPLHVLGLDSRGVGWVPTALLVALVISTPVAIARRLWALLKGLLLMNAYLLLTIGVHILSQRQKPGPMGGIELNPVCRALVDGLEDTLVTQVGASIVIPVVLWCLVCFKASELLGAASVFGSAPAVAKVPPDPGKNRLRKGAPKRSARG